MSHLKTAAIPDISLLFLDLFYGDGVLPAEYPARLQSIAILPLFQAAVEVVRSHLPYQGSMQINGAPLPAGDHSPNNGASKLTVR